MKLRIAGAAIILVATAWIVRSIGHGQPARLNQPLSSFPARLEEWSGYDISLSDQIERRLGVSNYLYKVYTHPSRGLVHLYVGYYESQKHGEMIHSPKNCLPGNGWYISHKDKATLQFPPYRPFEVNKYTIENDSAKQIVLYWYQQSGGRIVTNEYLGRVYLVVDAFTKKRTDAALIRLNIPIGESMQKSYETGVQFLKIAYPILMEFLPHVYPTQPS